MQCADEGETEYHKMYNNNVDNDDDYNADDQGESIIYGGPVLGLKKQQHWLDM